MIRSTRYARAVAAVVAFSPGTSVVAQDPPGQQVGGRFQVLVPDLEAQEGADRGFGRDVAEELRELLSGLPTHRAVARRDVERSLDQVGLDMEDLTCNLTRQLAARMETQVALCASYTEVARGRFSVLATFWDMRTGDAFTVEPTSGERAEPEAVALHIFDHFDRYTQHARAAANCQAFAQSNQFAEALAACDQALGLNPDAVGVRYRRARTLFDLGRSEESLVELERVLEGDPIHDAALELAGYVAATLDRRDDAVGYYTRYLQLDPGNAAVRMRVAYDVATAGDPRSALLLIREGLDGDPENIDLWEQLGGYAFAVAETINREQPREDGNTLAPDAVRYYREAVEAYERVYEERGAESRASHLRSLVVAYTRLDELPQALSAGSRGVETHGEDAALWSVYADALRRSDRLDDALDALDRVEALDPGYPNLGLRRGAWLVEDGRIEEAVEALRAVAAAEPDRADDAARLVLADAHANGVELERYDYAIASIELAKELPNLSDAMGHQLNFWHGYALLSSAADEQEPRTLESARATLPKFQRVLELLEDVGDYPASVGVSIEMLRSNVETFIEIQEAIIRRGGEGRASVRLSGASVRCTNAGPCQCVLHAR